MNSRTRPHILVLRVLIFSLLATLLGRLWVMQVHDAKAYAGEATANQVRDIVTQPPRGEIVDDMGRPLIDNRTALVVRVNRTKLMTVDEHNRQVRTPLGTKVLGRLSRQLSIPMSKLTQEIRLCNSNTSPPCWAGSPYEPIPVSQLKPTPSETKRALEIMETQNKYPGVSVEAAAVRHYPKPDGALASTILGYIGPITPAQLRKLPQAERAASLNAQVGKLGLEEQYEKYLHGRPGIKEVAVNAAGNPTGVIKNIRPRVGDTLVTNLDAKVQATLEKTLKQRIAAERAAGKTADYAAGVVLNVRTGGVVAMASEPTYQPQIFDNGITAKAYKKLEHAEGHPLVDKAYGSAAPPG
ncbi:MAG TPA: hypothetical protein VMD59_04000, partial [Acidimicrobiales bacterium]|nr:hypothetical protein [Acidimicrobiales bacterium]